MGNFWEVDGDLSQPRAGGGCVGHNESIYMFGGTVINLVKDYKPEYKHYLDAQWTASNAQMVWDSSESISVTLVDDDVFDGPFILLSGGISFLSIFPRQVMIYNIMDDNIITLNTQWNTHFQGGMLYYKPWHSFISILGNNGNWHTIPNVITIGCIYYDNGYISNDTRNMCRTNTTSPTQFPSNGPSASSSDEPSITPTQSPSNIPTNSPSNAPLKPLSSDEPSTAPSVTPTKTPTNSPTIYPSKYPTRNPTGLSTNKTGSFAPSNNPTITPSELQLNSNNSQSKLTKTLVILTVLVTILLLLISIGIILYRIHKEKSLKKIQRLQMLKLQSMEPDIPEPTPGKGVYQEKAMQTVSYYIDGKHSISGKPDSSHIPTKGGPIENDLNNIALPNELEMEGGDMNETGANINVDGNLFDDDIMNAMDGDNITMNNGEN